MTRTVQRTPRQRTGTTPNSNSNSPSPSIKREDNFIREYINHAKTLQRISNLNKNNLKFKIVPVNDGAKLSLVDNRGINQAYIKVEPKALANNKMGLYLALGESHIKLKGYGLYLRSLANKIARNIGSTETTQYAVNIRKMGGNKAPSSHLLERMGANTTWINKKSSSRRHRIDPLKSRTTTILAKRYGVRPPALPRNLAYVLYNSVNTKNLPRNAHSLNNSHKNIIDRIKNRQLKDEIDRLKRRVRHYKMISPRSLFSIYFTLLGKRSDARESRIKQLMKRKARTAMRSPKGRTLVNYSNL